MRSACGRVLTGAGMAAFMLLAVAGCVAAKDESCGTANIEKGSVSGCEVPGFSGHPYDIYLPADYDGRRAVPVVLALHGGGGNSAGAARTTCPQGATDNPRCLHTVAARKGFAVVYPSGTSSRLIGRIRTWNAGGGDKGWQCVSGRACELGVDEIAYFRALLTDLGRWLNIDESRIYATGLSNGGAMSHRLACQMADRIAAIAPVGGANQYAMAADCSPPNPVPVMQIHGTSDPCWPFEGGTAACAQRDGLKKISVSSSMEIWRRINGCGTAVDETLMAAEPGTESKQIVWRDCNAKTVLIRMNGGGHVWPGGWPYFGERLIGPMVHGFEANELILDFFQRHPAQL